MPPPFPRPRSLVSDLLDVARCDRACRDLAARRNEAEARAVARIQKCGDRYVACSEFIAEVGPDGRLRLSRFSYAYDLDALDDLADGPPPVADAATASEPDEGTQDELRASLAEHALVVATGQPDDRRIAEMAFVEAFDDLLDPMDHISIKPCS
jgi:hypothetical protein